MAIIFALIEMGEQLGFTPESLNKAHQVLARALSGMECMRRAAREHRLRTDRLGDTYREQRREFSIHRPPLEILRQAISVNAAVLQKQGRLGCIAPDAFADLLVVDGDPLQHIELQAAAAQHLRFIIRGGEIIRHQLEHP